MRTPRLFNLGCALLAFGVGLPALAEEAPGAATTSDATAPAVMEADEATQAADMPEPASESAADEQADAAPPAAEMAATDAEPASAEPMAAEAQAEPVAVQTTDESAAAPMPPAAGPMELGAVGYDDQGREGRIHVVSPGDTLWDISDGYLGTPWVWPSIWQDNQSIANPHLIFPGDRIWITPWEMRKLTAEEADALLAGQPAAADPLANLDAPEPEPLPAAMAPVANVAPAEQVTLLVPALEDVGLVAAGVVDAAASVVAIVGPRLMISEFDRVWIGLAEGETRPGDQFTVFRVQEDVFDPASGRLLGHHVAQLGWLEVVEVDDEASMAVVRKSNSEIEMGDKIIPREVPQDRIAISNAGADVEGQVSFLPQSRTHMGTDDFVYLNRGTLDGVDVGTPLTLFRKGFRARDNVLDANVQVPDRPFAELLVVRAEDEASVALVRKTEETIELGDYFRGAGN